MFPSVDIVGRLWRGAAKLDVVRNDAQQVNEVHEFSHKLHFSGRSRKSREIFEGEPDHAYLMSSTRNT